MKRVLLNTKSGVFHFVDGEKVYCASSDLSGDVTDLSGDVDDAELTSEQRTAGVDVADLISPEEA